MRRQAGVALVVVMMIVALVVVIAVGMSGRLQLQLQRQLNLLQQQQAYWYGIAAEQAKREKDARELKAKKPFKRGLKAPLEKPFERFREWYGRKLAASLQNRAGVYIFWIGITAMTVPLYSMSAKELAPMEREFIKMVLSKRGQEVVVRDGYVPVPNKVASKVLAELGIK